MLPQNLNRLITATGLFAGLAVLAACGPGKPVPQFNSDLEEKCYFEADAALEGPNRSLVRKGETFVEVVSVDGFARNQKKNDVFEACMAEGFGDNAPNKLSATGSLRFTSDEQKIWNGLSDAEKASAYAFIRNGGTLSGWAAENTL